jgi:tRNA(fMet)-specific endonuclease VapC
MPQYLLDTNILSDVIRNRTGNVAKKIGRMTRAERRSLCTSIIVAAELRFGGAKKSTLPLIERIDEVLQTVTVLPLEEDADRHYARLRAQLERVGSPISGNDLLIAAHALATNSILVTDNTREFRRIPELRMENWLRP